MSQIEQGTLARWVEDRGFGFIKPDAAQEPDLFVHVTAFPPGTVPVIGLRIEFEVADDRGRKVAGNVRPAE
jgi:cold shock CspA family protein